MYAVVHFLCLTKFRLMAKAEAYFSCSNIFTITHLNKTRTNNNLTRLSNTFRIKTESIRRSEHGIERVHCSSVDCSTALRGFDTGVAPLTAVYHQSCNTRIQIRDATGGGRLKKGQTIISFTVEVCRMCAGKHNVFVRG